MRPSIKKAGFMFSSIKEAGFMWPIKGRQIFLASLRARTEQV